MESPDKSPFTAAVQRLFELPEPGWADPPARWRNYAEQDGIGPDDVPDLIEVATDPLLLGAETDASDEVLDLAELNWAAPVHAWRALAKLRAEAALGPLVHLLVEADDWDTDWIHQELPDVFAQIGAPAVPVLLAHIDQAGHPEDAYLAWIEGLAILGNTWADQREPIVAALTEQLAQYKTNAPTLNAFFVFALVKLKAGGVAPLMEEAFRARRVDEDVAGNWDDAQILLGLKQPDAAYYERERQRMAKLKADAGGFDDEPGANPPKKPTAAEKAKKKARAKLAKASKKKNRKR